MGGGAGGAGGGGTAAPAPQAAGGNKGSSQAGTQSSQQLLEEIKRQRTYDQIGQGFKGLGAGISQQQPYLQQGQGQGFQSQAYQSPGAQTGANLSATGPLFSGPGGGIDEQKLAMILRQLGYG